MNRQINLTLLIATDSTSHIAPIKTPNERAIMALPDRRSTKTRNIRIGALKRSVPALIDFGDDLHNADTVITAPYWCNEVTQA